MKVLVCFKAVPNWEKVLDEDWTVFSPECDVKYAGTSFNCFDESALEMALRIKDGDGEAVIHAVTVAEFLSAPLVETLYAAGFDEVKMIKGDGSEFNSEQVALRLFEHAQKEKYDLLLTGIQAGMADTGLVPCYLAHKLGYNYISDVLGIEAVNGAVTVAQHDEKGLWERRFSFPAVVSVGNSPAVLRAVNLRQRVAVRGKSASVFEMSLSDRGVDPNLSRPGSSRILSMLTEVEPRLLAARLLEEFCADSKASSGKSGQSIPALPDSVNAFCCDEDADLEKLSRFLSKSDLLLLRDTPRGRMTAVELGVKMNAPVYSGVKICGFTKDGVLLRKRVCAANLDWEQECSYPLVLTVFGDIPEWAQPISASKVEMCGELSECLIEPVGESLLSEAKRVIICGAGVKSRETSGKARSLAKKLGASFALTRPAALCGWGTPDEIIGMSGSALSAENCLIFGASGAAVFLAGVENAGRIAAVNNDPKALIFQNADLGAVADAAEIIEEMLSLNAEGGGAF